MNIFVDPSLISEVLLKDGWHAVVPGTLNMGKYALVEPHMPAPAAPGFTFHEAGGGSISGPMSSILAVRHGQAPRTTDVTPEAPAVRPPAPKPPPAAKPQPAPDPQPPGSLPRDWWEP